MALGRQFYPDELGEDIRDRIWAALQGPLGLKIAQQGALQSNPGPADLDSLLPAIIVGDPEVRPELGGPVRATVATYEFEVLYFRALADGEEHRRAVMPGVKAIAELFARDDNMRLEGFSQPGMVVRRAFPTSLRVLPPGVWEELECLVGVGRVILAVEAEHHPQQV